MKDTLRKMLYFGVGAVSLTAEKVEAVVDELIQKGEATRAEKAQLVQEILEKVKEQEKELTAKIKNIIRKSREDLGIPTRKEFEALEKRIEALEKELASQKSKKKSDASS